MKTLGQIGYEAYAVSTGGLTWNGLKMPEWDALTGYIQKAWNDAALSIVIDEGVRSAARDDAVPIGKLKLAELESQITKLTAVLDAAKAFLDAQAHGDDISQFEALDSAVDACEGGGDGGDGFAGSVGEPFVADEEGA